VHGAEIRRKAVENLQGERTSEEEAKKVEGAFQV